jgi:3-oxoacyl-[acyl-carrier protein] reductase
VPDEIARVIEFLAGPGGDFMVGQVVSPNGGTAI